MFKQILIISVTFLIIILTYFVIKNILIRTHKLFLNDDIVKYTLHDSDRDYLNRYSKNVDIFELKNNSGVFYTNVKWSTKNNNYLKFKDRYYIIEPGYYYYITPNIELFLNKSIDIKLIKSLI
jgi:hypothetical protein